MDQGILVIIDTQNSIEVNINTEEMQLLCESAKVELLDTISFKRNSPDPNLFLGKGQCEYLSNVAFELGANVLIFSEELSPTQIRNLENITDKRIVDRTELILDIFAQRAKSNEGKIQVELAQLQYMLPRLTGKGVEMSRIGGGSGVATRGPGETKLETDKRKIKDKISKLKKDLQTIEKQRAVSNKNRVYSQVTNVSLFGYTSAGKSTLLSKLTGEEFYTDAMLFATLDSVTRKVNLNNNHSIFLSDTVGFLQRLPHNIIAAFKSTLEDLKIADILIHLVDTTKDDIKENIETVNTVLKELNIENKPVILAFNKCDIAEKSKLQELYYTYNDCIFISAKTGYGIEDLFKKVEKIISENFKFIKIILPYNNKNLNLIYKYGKIKTLEYIDRGTYIECEVPKEIYYYFQDYIV